MHKKFFFPILITIVLAILYGITIAPGLTWANNGADGGDLITAAFLGGIPHPTGYPLYLILAGIFQFIPLGSVAFRTNLFSAVCTISAAILIYVFTRRLLKEDKFSEIAAAIAAMFFGLSPLVWSQSVITEVYGLQSLLTIGILYQAFFLEYQPRKAFWRGLLFGLALGNHITTLFLFPLLFWDNVKKKFALIKNSPHILAGLLLGASIYLILPFRAMSQPPVNWFNPITIQSFFELLSGKIYQSYFSLSDIFLRFRSWLGLFLGNFSFLGVLIGIYAVLEGNKEMKRILPLLWLILISGLFTLVYASSDSYVYFTQTALAFSVLIGFGIHRALVFFSRQSGQLGYALAFGIICFFVAHIFIVMPTVDASKDTQADFYAKSVLINVPHKALVFTRDDRSTFSLWYYHFVENSRPDISVIAEGLLQFDWYRGSLITTYPSLTIPNDPEMTSAVMINNNSSRPFCFIDFHKSMEIECSIPSA